MYPFPRVSTRSSRSQAKVSPAFGPWMRDFLVVASVPNREIVPSLERTSQDSPFASGDSTRVAAADPGDSANEHKRLSPCTVPAQIGRVLYEFLAAQREDVGSRVARDSSLERPLNRSEA